MNKLLIFFLLLSGVVNAQTKFYDSQYIFKNKVAIGSQSVSSNPTDAWLMIGDSATSKALMIPRVQNTSAITTTRQGMVVYSISDSSFYYRTLYNWVKVGQTYTGGLPIRITGTTISVDTSVAYSPSLATNARLKKIVDSMASIGIGNIYTTNGTLAGNRTVTMNGKSLSFLNSGETKLLIDPIGDNYSIGDGDGSAAIISINPSNYSASFGGVNFQQFTYSGRQTLIGDVNDNWDGVKIQMDNSGVTKYGSLTYGDTTHILIDDNNHYFKFLSRQAERVRLNISGILIPNGIMPTSGSGGTDSVVTRNSSTGQFYLSPGGGGSGTNNANVGLGNRILKPSTQELKTLFAGDGITIDSTTNTNGLTITNTNVCGTGEVKEIVFDIGDYGFPQLYDNTYTRSAFADDVDVYRGGKLQKPNSSSFGIVQNTGTETLTFVPIFTGLEQMVIRKKEGCFSNESLRPVLLIANGESLMAGWGANSSDSATSTERAVRRMKNLNGDNLTFEVLNIGDNSSDANYNNYKGINRGGNETFARTHHGLEVGFANKYDSAAFDGRPVYFTKCALGGTRILDWRRTASTHYFDTLMKYVDTSYSKIVQETGREPIVFFLWECGVNDQVAAMGASAWQDTVSAFFSDMRSHFTATGIDTTYILMTKLASPSLYTGYNTNIDNLQTADANGTTFAIATTGAVYTCEDTSCRTHWGYTGQRNVVVGVLTTKIQDLLTRYQ